MQVTTGDKGLDRQVEDGYCGDLLSEIMGNAPEGCVWLTIQGHQNIVAVAVSRIWPPSLLPAAKHRMTKP